MFEWLLIFILLTVVIILFYRYSVLRGQVEGKARQLFDEWKGKEEQRIREDAIRRSQSTIIGKVGEHLTPIVIFSKYGINPKDFRFIGTPVDFIAFKGLSDGEVEKIYFIEVKSGKSEALTKREEMIKDAIESGKVEWLLIHLPTEIEENRTS
ncbi:MAG: Holliday junction resolvase-like protein [Nitrososphaeria archaeon]